MGTSPTTDPSNGERTSSVSPDRAAIHWPPISNWVFVNVLSSVVLLDWQAASNSRKSGSFHTLRSVVGIVQELLGEWGLATKDADTLGHVQRSWTIPTFHTS